VIAIENVRMFDETKEALRKLELRSSELAESLQHQTATSQILSVISSAKADIKPVFDAIVNSAARLFEPCGATITTLNEGKLHWNATAATLPDFDIERAKAIYPIPSDPERAPSARALMERRIIEIPDISAPTTPVFARKAAAAGGFRSATFVPLIKQDKGIGTIILTHLQAGFKLSEKQLALVRTFADQAVIAIENARLFDEVQAKTHDLEESLQQQTATADVLKVISRSAFDLHAVLQTLVESAAGLCEADIANIWRPEGPAFRLAASFGIAGKDKERLENAKYLEGLRIEPSRGSIVGRVLLEKRTVQVKDVQADPEYELSEIIRIGDYRTVLGVPLLREGVPIGVIFLSRCRVRPFTDKHIELVKTFADQAVIAIENARLFDEVQAKTRDLEESLQQQTATTDVLKVISRSPGELEPVFRAVLENATRICEAKFSNLFLLEGEAFRAVAVHGEPRYVESWQRQPLIVPREHPGVPLDRFMRTKEVLHIHDLTAETPYIEGDQRMVALVDIAGARTMLVVPMLRDNALIGAIVIYRREARAFTDKQIELVKNFASQAVIAFENARLLNELRESLLQQTATADVLKVISRSTFDLPAVLHALVETAAQLCDADKGTITREKDGAFYRAESYGFSEDFMNLVRDVPVVVDRHTATGRALLEGIVVHIADVEKDPDYSFGEGRRLGDYRALLGVPMLREGVPIGVITLTRTEPRAFTQKQIELAMTFADQAAIAIQNVRLFAELQTRTHELSESLQQQTATAEVLKVISRSPDKLKPVLDVIVETSRELCDALTAVIFLLRDGKFHDAAESSTKPEYIEAIRANPISPDQKGSILARAVREKRTVHIPNSAEDAEAGLGGPLDAGGPRSLLSVPLILDGRVIGGIALQQSRLAPFSPRQIEAVESFADQAVIAISNVNLFEQVQQRTHELSKSLDELRAAQDRLVQTEKLASLGQLTAGIAHEIKNPLNFVNNFSALSAELVDEMDEVLEEASLQESKREELGEIRKLLRNNLEKVVQHGKRADSIVKNMLLHSRSGSGERRPVEINAIMDESLNLAYHGARAEKQGFNITLERDLDPEAGVADIYPQEITRVFLNLISNGFYAASKRATEAGNGFEPKLRAVTRDLGDKVEIRIRDNGPGIPPEIREKIFNPFFTTKPAGEGTGLGLSISHDIVVKQHGGMMDVATEPGTFTEFIITLPRNAPAQTMAGEQRN